MAREQGLELRDTLIVRELQAAQERRIEVGEVVDAVAVAARGDSRVHARSVAVLRHCPRKPLFQQDKKGNLESKPTPDLKVRSSDGLAGLHVEHLEVEREGDTRLLFDDILADILASHVFIPVSRSRSFLQRYTLGMSTHTVRALGHLRAKDTRVVGREENALGRVQRVTLR